MDQRGVNVHRGMEQCDVSTKEMEQAGCQNTETGASETCNTGNRANEISHHRVWVGRFS